MFTRPHLAEIHNVLAKYNALIVHFSGTPKGAGSNFEHLFPLDLIEVIKGNAHTGLSCSTVLPGDNFANLDSANATGCIGVILGMKTNQSIRDAHYTDSGSGMENGIRIVPNARDMTVSEIENTISNRAPDEYNEWVIADYKVIGVFAAQPYYVWSILPITYPDDMPDYLRSPDPVSGIARISLEEIEAAFSELPIFTFSNGKLVVRKDLVWEPVEHSSLYD